MEKVLKELSPSRRVAAKTIYEAFKILKEAGGHLAGKNVVDKIRENLKFDDWEKTQYEKTGYIRWESILHFYTIDCIKAGFLRKQKGVWYLTEEGEKSIKLGPVDLLNKVSSEYRKWAAERKKDDEDEIELADKSQLQKANLEQLEDQAKSGLKEFIANKNAYEFQDMVAALLRSMGYFTPFVAPKGPDGGLDIVAYQDPLGTKAPRIKVQVKHRPDASVSVGDIKNLLGSLNKDGDVGLFVTSGGFTSEAEKFARGSHIHIKLIDFDNLIDLWQEYYPKFNDEEKNILPLHPIYFLGSNE